MVQRTESASSIKSVSGWAGVCLMALGFTALYLLNYLVPLERSDYTTRIWEWTELALAAGALVVIAFHWRTIRSITVWIGAGLGMLVIMACVVEVGSQFSEQGGAYLYVRTAFGRFAGVEIGWFSWLAPLAAAAANARAAVRDSTALVMLSLLATYRFPTAEFANRAGRPVLVMHGNADSVIPFARQRSATHGVCGASQF